MGVLAWSRAAEVASLLLIEDDADTREVLGDILGSRGLGVITAENGADALALLELGLRPSAILLDLWMPVVDGFEFRRCQRLRPDLARIPTIVTSATRISDEGLVELGADAYVHKPLGIRELEEVLGRVLGLRIGVRGPAAATSLVDARVAAR